MASEFDLARAAYCPSQIKYLFVAEAPPSLGSGRFFYFPDVRTGDSLFLEMMKVLYPDYCSCAADIRPRKAELLERFKREGYYLIDSVDQPLKDPRPMVKRRDIQTCLPTLIQKIHACCQEGTGVILISATVYEVCVAPLLAAGIRILNTESIDFPGSGGQRKFREKLGKLMQRAGYVPPAAGVCA